MREPLPSKKRRAAPRSTITGDVRTHSIFGRRVSVWLPPRYESAKARYPVLYLQDGQNAFDAATSAIGVEWQADETATRLIRGKKIRPIVIVAIDNVGKERLKEYAAPVGRNPGTGDTYARFVADTVVPFIDNTYRTTTETAVCGSSLGANISLWIAARYPERFTMCAALSPAIWWQGKGFVDALEESLETRKLAIYVGTKEGRNPRAYVRAARRLRDACARARLSLKYKEVDGGTHNEADWAKQLPEILEYFFG